MARKPVLTVTQFARMGGKARMLKISPERRREIAAMGGQKARANRLAKLEAARLAAGGDQSACA